MKFEKKGVRLQICRNKETQIYCEVKRQTSATEKKTIQTKMTDQKVDGMREMLRRIREELGFRTQGETATGESTLC
jgi:hypothetical protein